MSLATISYHKVRHLPIYYRVDWHACLIESLKAWPNRPQSVDVFPLEEEFARNISQQYPLIRRSHYLAIRRGILQPSFAPRHRSDREALSPPPRGHSETGGHPPLPYRFDTDDPA